MTLDQFIQLARNKKQDFNAQNPTSSGPNKTKQGISIERDELWKICRDLNGYRELDKQVNDCIRKWVEDPKKAH